MKKISPVRRRVNPTKNCLSFEIVGVKGLPEAASQTSLRDMERSERVVIVNIPESMKGGVTMVRMSFEGQRTETLLLRLLRRNLVSCHPNLVSSV